MLLFISRTFFNKNRNSYLGENFLLFNALLQKDFMYIIVTISIFCIFFCKVCIIRFVAVAVVVTKFTSPTIVTS